MLLENKSLSEITEQDLLQLIDAKESEGKKLDFKRELPGNSDRDKKRFLEDICAFANAGGGFIIYGMEEKAGKATVLNGFQTTNIDQEILRLQSIIQSGLAPRVPGIHMRPIGLSSGTSALVIKIPLSWASPHMITLEGASKFYTRNSSGNYQMDVQEIKTAFLSSDSLSTAIKDFRLNRLGRIVAGETPILIKGNAKIILHLIPLTALYNQSLIDMSIVLERIRDLHTLYFSFCGFRINFDGAVTYSQKSDDRFVSYTQIFKNGIIEAVHDEILDEEDGKQSIPSSAFEKIIFTGCEKLLFFQNSIGIEPPIVVFLSLVGMSGYSFELSQSQKFYYRRDFPVRVIDRDTLLTPEVMIQNFESLDIHALLKPAIDSIWNAAGWPNSLNFDQDGKWHGENY
ncbi:MAG: ATP-binding protein [Anaerolineaceae bacterium]